MRKAIGGLQSICISATSFAREEFAIRISFQVVLKQTESVVKHVLRPFLWFLDLEVSRLLSFSQDISNCTNSFGFREVTKDTKFT